MSAFTGPQHRGAARTLKAVKRSEADARNLLTPPGRRRQARRDLAAALNVLEHAHDSARHRDSRKAAA